MFKTIRKYLLLFVVVLALICGVVFAACEPTDKDKTDDNNNQQVTPTPDPDPTPTPDPDPTPTPTPTPNPHVCGDKCPTCEKCTTECEDEACKEKCPGHGTDPDKIENVAFILGELANIDELVAAYGSTGASENVELFNDGNTVITGMSKMKINTSAWNYHTGGTVTSNDVQYEIPGLEEAEDITFTHRLQTGGKVTVTKGVVVSGAVKIEVADAAHVTVYARSGSSNGAAADRQFGFYDEAGTLLHQFPLPESTEGLIYTYDMTAAGTVYAGGTNGFNIQYIKVEYDYVPAPHACHDKCPECEKCTTDCQEPECAEKCPGHVEPEEPKSYDLSTSEPTVDAIIGANLALATTFNLLNVEAGDYTLTLAAGPAAGMAEIYAVVGEQTITLTNNQDGTHSGVITIAEETSIKVYTNGATLEEVTVTLTAGGEIPAGPSIQYVDSFGANDATISANAQITDGDLFTLKAGNSTLKSVEAAASSMYNGKTVTAPDGTTQLGLGNWLHSNSNSGKEVVLTAKADITVTVYYSFADSSMAGSSQGASPSQKENSLKVTGDVTYETATAKAGSDGYLVATFKLATGNVVTINKGNDTGHRWNIFAIFATTGGEAEVEPEVLEMDTKTEVTIPDSGEAHYTLNVPETGSYTLTIEGEVTAYYIYDEAIDVANFTADPDMEIVFKGNAGATAQVTLSKYVPAPSNALTVGGTLNVTFDAKQAKDGDVVVDVLLENVPEGKYELTLANLTGSKLGTKPVQVFIGYNELGQFGTLVGPKEDTIRIVIPAGATALQLRVNSVDSGTSFTADLTLVEYVAPEIPADSTLFEDVEVGGMYAYFAPIELNLNGLKAGTYTLTVETTFKDNWGDTFVYNFVTNPYDAFSTTIATVTVKDGEPATTTIVITEDMTSIYVGSSDGSGNKISVTFTAPKGTLFEDVEVGGMYAYYAPIELNLNGLAAGTYTITVETTLNDNWGSEYTYNFVTNPYDAFSTGIASVTVKNGETASTTITITEGMTSIYVGSSEGGGNKISITFTPA